MCKFYLNNELNGIELSFNSKPEKATLEAVKAHGFKWHNVKKVWYAKQTADRLTFAETIGNLEKIETGTATRAPKAQPEKINLEGLENLKKTCYGSDFAKVLRQELKNRGIKGVTIRSNRAGYSDSYTVTITTTNDDYRSIEEVKERVNLNSEFLTAFDRGIFYNNSWHYYKELEAMTAGEKETAFYSWLTQTYYKVTSINHYHASRENYAMFTKQAFDRITAIIKIVNAYNYDNSDLMSDYFDVGFYLDVDIKQPESLLIRETMTEEERKALEAEREEEARQAEQDRIRFEEERKQAEKARKEREEAEKRNLEEIAQNTTVVDCDPEYITALVGGIGKEATLSELAETINGCRANCTDAVITRKVYFATKTAFNAFCAMFLYDFEFLSGKGGTASNDVRLKDFETLSKLTEEQRQTIKFFCNDCVAVFDHNNELRLIIDPQGYNYARYTYTPTEESEILEAKTELEKQENESKEKAPFYVPNSVDNQIQALQVGDPVTVIYTDSWLMFATVKCGTITAINKGKCAQYTGYWVTLQNGKKTDDVFIRDNKEFFVYRGILPKYPESITHENEKTTATARSYFLLQGESLLKAIYNYYMGLGITPTLDTMPR